jgi:hypothetical protein
MKTKWGRCLAFGTLLAFWAGRADCTTIYVSRLGDDSNGASWTTAFRTVQKALNSVPDDKGGHRIVIRPDTYIEANLFPAQKGAKAAYNTIESDFDGSKGSGASGYAVFDCGDPEKGLKSVDWWSNFRASPDFSGIGWDRWIVRHVYATGGDAGLFWDLPPKMEPFTVVVEDSIGIGRAFGGGAAHFLPRADEPIVFRRCQLWCLDWWGDAAGAYVRAENEAMQASPDIVFEECTLTGPDNALQAGNPGFAGSSRVKLKGCKLVALNFSQPRGKPSSGAIFSTIEGKYLHVDLEDTTVMGYKVFGAGNGDVSYTTKGSVLAYVQFEQEVPAGFTRIGHWPVEVFQSIVPPQPASLRPVLRKEGVLRREMCESSPVIWQGRLCLMECVRPATGGTTTDYYLLLRDVETDKEIARFGEGYGLACAFEFDGTFYAFASRFEGGDWNDVTQFESKDLMTWSQRVVVQQEKEHLFNSSVCFDGKQFVMAYESNDPAMTPFTIKFARSPDLQTWEKVPGALLGPDRYAACPCIRFVDGQYYVLYLEHLKPRWYFETHIARSNDLVNWELGKRNPVLAPDKTDDGINASDPDLVEFGGKTYIYYSVGDQRTWSNSKRAVFDGKLSEFAGAYFN